MKRILTLTFVSFLSCISASAQISLPYYSGFDSTTEQNGWVEYKKEATTFSHWGYSSANGFSGPNCISHDYSPSTGITLTDNWFVSPGFSLDGGGTLDSIRYMFSGFSTPVPGDTVAIYLLNGAQDPSLASSKTLLFDFRDSEYNPDFAYRIQENIALPAYNGLGYIAIRYRNTDCSSKWLTVHFDNVAISGGTLGINENAKVNQIRIYPNPTTDAITIQTDEKIESVDIFNITGMRVKTLNAFEIANSIDVSSFNKGIYLMNVKTVGGNFVKRLVVN